MGRDRLAAMHRFLSIRWLLVALLAWAAPTVAHAGFLVPGDEGAWHDLTGSWNTESREQSAPRDSEPLAPNQDAQFRLPADGMTTNDMPPRSLTNAFAGWVSRIIGGEIRLDVARMVRVHRQHPRLAGIFRPPKEREEPLLSSSYFSLSLGYSNEESV